MRAKCSCVAFQARVLLERSRAVSYDYDYDYVQLFLRGPRERMLPPPRPSRRRPGRVRRGEFGARAVRGRMGHSFLSRRSVRCCCWRLRRLLLPAVAVPFRVLSINDTRRARGLQKFLRASVQ